MSSASPRMSSIPELPAISPDDVIESTAPLEHGDSGGPLGRRPGPVVGINMAKPVERAGGISLPADLVVEVVKRLMAAAK